jgi:hypothetical protein
VGPGGSAFIAGRATSNDFPTTPGAFQPAAPGGPNGFVAKLNPTGSQLIYSTYLGGSGYDQALAIGIDSNQNAYVTGSTYSVDFPTTLGAFQMVNKAPAGGNAFVTKLNDTGSGLVYSTYLGGTGNGGYGDIGFGIAADAGGNAYIVGYTASPDFPTTDDSLHVPLDGTNGFVTKLNHTGSVLVYSTYLGGSGYDYASAVTVDSAANAYVTGITYSTDFPTTPGAFQPTPPGTNGSGVGFVTKISNTTTAPRSVGELSGSDRVFVKALPILTLTD